MDFTTATLELIPVNSTEDIRVEEHRIVVTVENELETVEISVYYESLCPDCRQFFMTQLLPVVARLFQNVNIYLVPYGHAKSTHLANGTIEFECQHGPAECYGNKLHACAIDKLRRPAWYAPLFTTCLMAQSDRGSNDRALVNCGQLMSVQVDSIADCGRGSEGVQLLEKYENETNKYNPYSVPFVLLNNSSDNQDELVENLLGAVCKVFRVKPPGCSEDTDKMYDLIVPSSYSAHVKMSHVSRPPCCNVPKLFSHVRDLPPTVSYHVMPFFFPAVYRTPRNRRA
ncbi:Gamma-interferon-inducible lysosomal thiol reductase [Eumeta japonica]|uniref:Gamma-interferon-inducible lysosomal thiol reductase n=1 Tax=Eumeta variegata TaxID=151549 RepID=A0A4C1VMR7_EUMVA|nr:Gamma-interferon-inducible lysosomal thiol reductase [Eumeta japonica]